MGWKTEVAHYHSSQKKLKEGEEAKQLTGGFVNRTNIFGFEHRIGSLHLSAEPKTAATDFTLKDLELTDEQKDRIRNLYIREVQETLTTYCPDLKGYKKWLIEPCKDYEFYAENQKKTNVVSLGVVDQDCDTVSGNASIMHRINKNWIPNVITNVGGDQKTVAMMRTAKESFNTEEEPENRMKNLMPAPIGLFHVQGINMECYMKQFFKGSARNIGMPLHTKNKFNFKKVSRRPMKCFNHLHDMIVLNTSGLILKYFAEQFKMTNPMDEGAWKDVMPEKNDESEKQFLYEISKEFVDLVIMFETLEPPAGYRTHMLDDSPEGDEGSDTDNNDDINVENNDDRDDDCDLPDTTDEEESAEEDNNDLDEEADDEPVVIKSRRLTKPQSGCGPELIQEVTIEAPKTDVQVRRSTRARGALPTLLHPQEVQSAADLSVTLAPDVTSDSASQSSKQPAENALTPLPDHRLPVYKDLVNEGLRHMSFRRAIREGDGPTCGTMFIAQTPTYKKYGCKNYVKLSMYRALIRLGVWGPKPAFDNEHNCLISPDGGRMKNHPVDWINERLNDT